MLDNFFHGAKCFNDHDDDYQCDQIWTIFESSWQQFFSYKISEIFGNRWCYFETITFKLKCYCYFFGNFWNKLGYFYLIYGHTDDDQHEQGGRRRRGELFRKTFQQFHFKLKFWKKHFVFRLRKRVKVWTSSNDGSLGGPTKWPSQSTKSLVVSRNRTK